MKKRLIIVIGFFCFCLAIFKVGMVAGAANSASEPGSSKDPLITQSYLEKRLKEVSSGTSQSNINSSYKKVTLSKGNTITVETGTEIILYSGNANVFGNTGLVNVSTGELFKNGNSVVKYNVFVSPGSDSGIKATSSITILIRGKYQKG